MGSELLQDELERDSALLKLTVLLLLECAAAAAAAAADEAAASVDASTILLCATFGVEEETKPMVSTILLAKRAMRLAPVDKALENMDDSTRALELSCRFVFDVLVDGEADLLIFELLLLLLRLDE